MEIWPATSARFCTPSTNRADTISWITGVSCAKGNADAGTFNGSRRMSATDFPPA